MPANQGDAGSSIMEAPARAALLTSVYVHFPWCARKCPYCDFATRRVEVIPHVAYADAILRELEARAAALEGRRLFSIFLGGGTPSLWDPAQIARVIGAVRDAFSATIDEVEITAEANPSSLSSEQLEGFAEAGVNRLSVGVQSLRDEHLGFLGRLHDRAAALAALERAVATFGRVSADLMFGMPDQTLDAWSQDVRELLQVGVEHVSAYALTIEPGTQFGALHRLGKLRVASEDDYAAMFERVRAVMADHGLEHYEVSNYARPGARARHNEHYWRGGDYLGLGAAAVGCLTEGPGRAVRYKNEVRDERYIEAGGESERELLTGDDLVREGLMLGLRTRDGVDVEALSARAAQDWRRGRERAVAARLDRGDLVLEGSRLRVPAERWLWLDGIVADLF